MERNRIYFFVASCLLAMPMLAGDSLLIPTLFYASGSDVYKQPLTVYQKGDSVVREFSVAEVEVRAKVLEKDVIRPQILKGEQLRVMNVLSVADAIRYFAGVQIKDYGGVAGIKTVNIRSMGTHHLGVYYNGIQLGNVQNGQVDLGKFSLENIEEIDLYNGQKSDIFQSAREFGSAGSIYLTTRRPRFKLWERFHVRGQMRFGSFGLVNPSVAFDIRLSEKMSATVNAELVEASGRYKFRYRTQIEDGGKGSDTSAIRVNGDIHAVRVESSLNHYYSNSGFWKLLLYHYNSERGVPGAVVNGVFKNVERLWDRNSFAQMSWQDEFFRRWSVRFNAKYAHDYTHYNNFDEKQIRVDNDYLQQEFYGTVVNKVQIFHWWDMSLAYDFQWNGLSKYMTASRLSHWLAGATAFNFRDYIRVQASLLGTFVDEGRHGGTKAPDKQKCTPAVFLSYRPSQKVDIRFNAFYKHSYRYPTFNDLYYADVGQSNLKPELAKQCNVGLAFDLPFKIIGRAGSLWHTTLDAYYNLVSNKIIAYPKGQQFRWTMMNLGKVDIRGIDFTSSLLFALPKQVSLIFKVQYTYQEAIDITNPKDGFYRHQIPYIPWHSGSVVGTIRWREYTLNYSFMYVGERYDEQENIKWNYMQPWYTHDISISGEWTLNKRRMMQQDGSSSLSPCLLRAGIDVNNFLGQDYEIIRNYPMPKTNLKCTISITY